MLIVRVSSNKNGGGGGDTSTRACRVFHLSGTIKSKTEGSWTYVHTLEEARPDHAIRSAIAITKLLLGHDILTKKKKNNNNNKTKEKCDSYFSGFLNFLA